MAKNVCLKWISNKGTSNGFITQNLYTTRSLSLNDITWKTACDGTYLVLGQSKNGKS